MPVLSTLALAATLLSTGCKKKQADNPAPTGTLQLSAATLADGRALSPTDPAANAEIPTQPVVTLAFGVVLDTVSVRTALSLKAGATAEPLHISFSNDATKAILTPSEELEPGTAYNLGVGNTLKGEDGSRFAGVTYTFTTEKGTVLLDSVYIDNIRVTSPRPQDVSYNPTFKFYFSGPLSATSVQTAMSSQFISGKRSPAQSSTSLSSDGKVLTVTAQSTLASLTKYTLNLPKAITGSKGQAFAGYQQVFYTKLDMTDKFPRISDDELLDKVEKQTFMNFFWNGAHPASGLVPDRASDMSVITTGGSSFGVMTIIPAIDRGWISRSDGVAMWDKQTKWLKKADRFHGAWPHWFYSSTGRVHPFGANDNGGDLVETAFMAQGLITVRQFLNRGDANELKVVNRIDSLLNEIEWDWYRHGPDQQQVLYWHWSPDKAWIMNFPLRGWNETLITYIMAAASTTHTIPRTVYDQGFCTGDHYLNGRSFYGIPLQLGFDYGGPAFFTHYSFLGLNPTGLQDPHANYQTLNTNHTLINYQHCVRNPNKYVLYGPECWGLTASDIPNGYNANSPTDDNGTITPTAALSCMPYAPQESMAALRFFYYKMGDRLWKDKGFVDAFNPTEDWYDNDFLSIDQGPIIVMMENYRTQRLWNLFMSAPEVQQGLTKLGFTH